MVTINRANNVPVFSGTQITQNRESAAREFYPSLLMEMFNIPTAALQGYNLLHKVNNRVIRDIPSNETIHNFRVAKEAYNYVLGLNLVSNTKLEMQNRFTGEDYEPYEKAVSDGRFLNRQRNNLSIEKYIDFTTKTCPLLNFGNCSDQAILIANHLKNKGIKNFAMIAAIKVDDEKAFEKNPMKYAYNAQNHVFVVLGLAPDAKLNDPSTWGKNAVIVDPWGEICLPVSKDSIEKIKQATTNHRYSSIKFMNYAPFIDPTNDTKSDFNWLNYQRKILSGDEIFSLPQEICEAAV